MIRELLEAHYKRPYPAESHAPVADVDLEMLDGRCAQLATEHRARIQIIRASSVAESV